MKCLRRPITSSAWTTAFFSALFSIAFSIFHIPFAVLIALGEKKKMRKFRILGNLWKLLWQLQFELPIFYSLSLPAKMMAKVVFRSKQLQPSLSHVIIILAFISLLFSPSALGHGNFFCPIEICIWFVVFCLCLCQITIVVSSMQMCLFCRIECDFNSAKLLFGFNDIIELQKKIYWKLLYCLLKSLILFLSLSLSLEYSALACKQFWYNLEYYRRHYYTV